MSSSLEQRLANSEVSTVLRIKTVCACASMAEKMHRSFTHLCCLAFRCLGKHQVHTVCMSIVQSPLGSLRTTPLP